MDPITIAMGLANFAPQIIKWISGSDKAESAATAVVNIAQQITGKGKPDDALDAIKADPALALEFRTKIMQNEADLDMAYLKDIQSARDRDVEFIKAGATNHRPDIMFILAVFTVTGMVYIIWQDPTINEYVKGIFTLVLGRFLGYLDGIYNFEFGSTRSGKVKDQTIKNLSSV